MRVSGRCLLVLTLTLLSAPPLHGATLLQPGYTDRLVTTVAGSSLSAGGLRLDPDGQLLVASEGTRSILRVDPFTGATRVIATATPDMQELEDVTVLGDEILVTARWRPQFLKAGLHQSGGPLTPFHTLEATRNPLSSSIAPAGFGPFGGQLVYTTFAHYGLEALDLESKVSTRIVTVNFVTDVAFSAHGTLLGVDFDLRRVVEITPAGGMRDVATFEANTFLDGIAIHPVTGLAYVADAGQNKLWELDPVTGRVSTFGEDADFHNGFSKSGLTFSADGTTLFYSVGETGHQIRAIGGFPAVPEPLSLPLHGLAAAASCVLRPARRGGPRSARPAPLAVPGGRCR